MTAIFAKGSGTTISIRVQPGASKTEVSGMFGDSVKIRIHAPPVDGKANETLVEFLAEVLEVPKKRVTLIAGESSRSKVVHIEGVGPETVKKKLGVS